MIRNTSLQDDDSVNRLLETLSHPVRRTLLRRLRTNDTPDTVDLENVLDELVDETETSRENLEIALHHNHLPALESAGLIDVDDERRTIRYRPRDRVDRILDAVSGVESNR